MADFVTPEKRSEIMSRIRGSGNRSTELRMISLMRLAGITGWRRRFAILGKPDFVFPGARVALFVDGDFWHGHPTRFVQPKTNSGFWAKKIRRNKARDRLVTRSLRADGWTVVRVWESALARRPETAVRRVFQALNGKTPFLFGSILLPAKRSGGRSKNGRTKHCRPRPGRRIAPPIHP